MTVLKIERNFAVPPERVFAYVTTTGNLAKWWGPEGTSLPGHDMDLSRPGAWCSTMINAQGGRHKVSGVVVAVAPPSIVEFTWAWHNADDLRGQESRVRFEIRPDGAGGTHFVLIHSGLTDAETAANHDLGWTSSLRKLERLASGN